jgi:DNA polymerase-3 subunit beta
MLKNFWRVKMANAAVKEKPEDSAAASGAFKIKIDRSSLLKALSHVQSVVERRGTIPILANVKLSAAEGQLELSATDMDIAVEDRVNATIETQGAVTVPAHTFYDIVRKLPDGSEVELRKDADSGKLTLRCGSSRFSLATLPVEDFPAMAEGDLSHHFTLSAVDCVALLEKTRFAVSTEETRYYLNGVYLHSTEINGIKVMRAVATDGHRLARIEIPMPEGAAGMPGIIIPRKTLGELRKLVEDAATIEISLSATKIRFRAGDATLMSKLIDGTFPDYERVIPQGNDRILEVDTKALTTAVDRVSVISSEKSRGIKVALQHGRLTLSASSAEQGTANEELDVTYAAEPMETGFNSRYLLDMMAQIEGDVVQFVLADATAPALVRDPADVGAVYVIMPMRV